MLHTFITENQSKVRRQQEDELREAGLDEGLLSFSLSSSRLHGESLEVQQISVTNNIAPS